MIQPRQITPEPFADKRIRRSFQELDARGEQGFVLLAVLFLLVLVVLALAIAAPKVATDLQRDKEIETVNRGLQYKRAIKLYYKKFGGYPSSIDQLMNSNGQRFLRKHYLDPITGKDDWRIIHVGEAKVPPMGPFGQPIAGAIAGGTPAGAASPLGSGSGFGSSNSGFGSSSSDSGSSIFGSSNTGSLGSGNSSLPLGGGISGGTGSATGSSTGSATGATGTGSSAFGTPGATMGGPPIMGVGLPTAKASIKIYKKQTQYNRWEFCYFPNEDLGGGGGAMGQSTLQPTGSTGAGGTSSGFGGSTTSGFGGSSGSTGTGFGGSSPTSPSSSTSPFGGSSFP